MSDPGRPFQRFVVVKLTTVRTTSLGRLGFQTATIDALLAEGVIARHKGEAA